MKSGSIVKLLRATDGLSQTDLAKDLGIARTYLSQIENEKVEPGLTFLKAVSKKFSIPLSLLVLEDSDENHEIFGELQNLLGRLLSARIAIRGD